MFQAAVIKIVSVDIGNGSHVAAPKMTTPAGAGVVALKGLAN
jgi:hypothetical protein